MATPLFPKRDGGSLAGRIARVAVASAVLFGTLPESQCFAQEPLAATSPVLAPNQTSSSAGREPTSRSDAPAFKEQTLLGDGPIDHGGYGGPLVRFSSFDHTGALFVGGRGGWLINHRLLLGGAGMAQALAIDAPPESIDRYPRARNLEFAYGGFLLGYHIAPESRLHGFASVLLAGGGLVLSNRNGDSEESVVHDGVFVMEPELAVEANLLSFMRLQVSLGYRMVSDVELVGIDNADASGISGGVAFLFGDF